MIPGGVGGVLSYFHAYIGSGYFWGFKIPNFIILGVFRKIYIFWGVEDFVDRHKIGLVLGSFLCILGSFF